MFEHLDSSVMSETLKKAFFSILLELVPYTYSISLEGTVGITIDNKQMLFLHFSDTVNKSSEIDGATVKSFPQPVKRDSFCSKRSLGNEVNKVSVPGAHHKSQSNCSNGGMKDSSLLGSVHPTQSAFSFEDVLVQSTQTDYLAGAEACSELPIEKSTAARRKGRPAKFPSDGVTIIRNVSSNHVSSVCPVTGEEETEMSPQAAQSSYVSNELDGLEVLDFSTHSKMELSKRNSPDFSGALNENPKCSGFQMGSVDNEIESAPTKASTRNQQDRTLLRQLLLNNTKTKKVKSGKRRLSGSDDDSNKKICIEASSSVAENSKNGSCSLLVQELDACMVGGASWTIPSNRGMASKRTEAKSTEDSGGERRANPDSILCRLLTSGVNMYDTTEVERLRQASSNKQKVARDWDVSQTTATTSRLSNTIVDLMLTNVKTEREPFLRTDEFVHYTPVEPIKEDPLCFQSSVQHQISNSPLGQVFRSGLGPLKCLPDAAVTVPPQLQANCNVAEQCLAIVKEEWDDSVDVRRTLYVSTNNKFPSDAQTKENLYQTHFTKSSDSGK